LKKPLDLNGAKCSLNRFNTGGDGVSLRCRIQHLPLGETPSSRQHERHENLSLFFLLDDFRQNFSCACIAVLASFIANPKNPNLNRTSNESLGKD
jgi:hypothetical protein